MANLAPLPVQRFYDNANNPLVGGLLYTYQAGTSTPQATYTDSTGGTPNSNPIVLNSRGEANVWLTPSQNYKFVLKDSVGNTIWTVDQVSNGASTGAVNIITSVSGTNTITALCSSITNYASNQIFAGIAANTNTGATTININGLGPVSVVNNGAALVGGEIQANLPFELYYDGSKLNLISPSLSVSGGGLLGALNWASPVTLASAATVNIGAAASNVVIISGTTTITAFDTIAAGAMRFVRFSGALTLTYNATSLILPGSANITTAANDEAVFVSLGSGNWKCISYTKANGASTVLPISLGTAANTTSGTSVDITGIPSSVKRVTVMLDKVSTSGTSNLLVQIGSGSVSTSGYASQALAAQANASSSAAATSTSGFLATASIAASTDTHTGHLIIENFNNSIWICNGTVLNNSGTRSNVVSGDLAIGSSIDRIRLTTVNGTDTFDNGSVNILYE